MRTITPTSQQFKAATELEKVNEPTLGYIVDAGFLDAPSTESCQQCGEGPGICFVADAEVDLSMIPDRRDPEGKATLGVVRVCNPLCVACCVSVAHASREKDRVFSVDLATWAQ